MAQAKAWVDLIASVFGLLWVAIGMPLAAWWAWRSWRNLEREGAAVRARLAESSERLDAEIRRARAALGGRAN